MPQPLPSKEMNLFRTIIQLYEAKQYKKAIKSADQILKKFPDHGDTQAMKALVLNAHGGSDEAFALAKTALRNDIKSHICWHVYGLLYRSVRNMEEAVKAYKRALKLAPESPQIMRDLALLQMQIRDLTGYIETRKLILQLDRAGLRQNWTALAAGYHVAGDLAKAEETLNSYDATFQRPPPPTDLEYTEMCLYKNTLIAESGDYKRALEHLDTFYTRCFDRTLVMERKAEYLLKSGELDKAKTAYKALLERNSDNWAYFLALEQASNLDRTNPADETALVKLYRSIAQKYPGSDAARRIPLEFVTGDRFEETAEKYIRNQLRHAVPFAFSNIKGLYVSEARVPAFTAILNRFIADSSSDEDELKSMKVDLLFFIAQHFGHRRFRDLPKALDYIEQAIVLSPKSVDLYVAKAKMLKHLGDTSGATAAVNQGRELEPKDRHVGTKSSKYYLRNNDNDTALSLIRPFLRQDAPSGPIGDLFDLQCLWFLSEDGLAYLRQNNYNLALKRLCTVTKVFEVWYDDQFDFHAFAFRKGQVRPYIDMIRWEDTLRKDPVYTRAAISAIEIYTILADEPRLGALTAANGLGDLDLLDESSRKQATKRAAHLRERSETERKDLERKAASKPTVDGESKRPDKDPLGLELLQTKTPLDEAAKLLAPMLQFTPDLIQVQHAAFEVYIRQKKFQLALNALNATAAIDSNDPTLNSQIVSFRLAVETQGSDLDAAVTESISQSKVAIPEAKELKSFIDEFVSRNKNSVRHAQAGLQSRVLLNSESKGDYLPSLLELIDLPEATYTDAEAGLTLLKKWKLGHEAITAYKVKGASRWPSVSAFSTVKI